MLSRPLKLEEGVEEKNILTPDKCSGFRILSSEIATTFVQLHTVTSHSLYSVCFIKIQLHDSWQGMRFKFAKRNGIKRYGPANVADVEKILKRILDKSRLPKCVIFVVLSRTQS